MSSDPYFVRMQQSFLMELDASVVEHNKSWQVVRSEDGAVVGRYAEHGAAASACYILNKVSCVNDPQTQLELYARLQRNQ